MSKPYADAPLNAGASKLKAVTASALSQADVGFAPALIAAGRSARPRSAFECAAAAQGGRPCAACASSRSLRLIARIAPRSEDAAHRPQDAGDGTHAFQKQDCDNPRPRHESQGSCQVRHGTPAKGGKITVSYPDGDAFTLFRGNRSSLHATGISRSEHRPDGSSGIRHGFSVSLLPT
jgi:hypothetical protein